MIEHARAGASARHVHIAILIGLLAVSHQIRAASGGAQAQSFETRSCFFLAEIGVGELRRSPSTACDMRITPASTFKVPHSLAALDAGVLSGPYEVEANAAIDLAARSLLEAGVL